MKFDPIGSTFKEGDVTLKVVQIKDWRTCKGCWYKKRVNGRRLFSGACYVHGHACTSGNRKDKKQVIFVEQKL